MANRKEVSMGRGFRWAILLLSVFLFCGCDESNPFDKKYVPPRIKPPPKKRLTVRRQTIGFVYIPVNKRDPFRPPYLTLQKVAGAASPARRAVVIPTKKRKPQTELEKYELDQLTVVATVTGVANPIAMVQDPRGFGYMVRRGTVIGRNAGRVQRIHSDGIVIAEESRDEAGRRIVSRVKLRIKSKKNNKNFKTGRVFIGGRRVNISRSSLFKQYTR